MQQAMEYTYKDKNAGSLNGKDTLKETTMRTILVVLRVTVGLPDAC